MNSTRHFLIGLTIWMIGLPLLEPANAEYIGPAQSTVVWTGERFLVNASAAVAAGTDYPLIIGIGYPDVESFTVVTLRTLSELSVVAQDENPSSILVTTQLDTVTAAPPAAPACPTPAQRPL